MKRNMVRFLTFFMLVTLVLAAAIPVNATSAGAPAGKSASVNGVYIVQMIDPPVVAYKGGIGNYQATAVEPGQKIDPSSAAMVNYAAYLDSTHQSVLTAAGGGARLYDYQFSFNGFAAKMTEAQAKMIASQPGVAAVNPDQIYTMDTASTPSFLGLDAPGGLWEQLGGVDSAGEGVIIGVIDSGIWPESLSFSDRTDEDSNASEGIQPSHQKIPGWHGRCVPGEKFKASLCNQKLIGARYFNAGLGGNDGINEVRPWEFNSPRDYNGHGTHTASTAGGNHDVEVTGPAAIFGNVSGIAPRAHIATYKALWSSEDASTASGTTSDLVAAIDKAVADGVDVINYSVSGTPFNFADPAQIAFLFAAQAGVFVAASAGNNGPEFETVAHPSPWITTVAAGTHNRDGLGSVTLGNGETYQGASVAKKVGPAPLIDASAAGQPGADPDELRLCFASIDNEGVPVLDPEKVAGKIVVCDRGVSARINKSRAVQQAGGVGMILVNTSPNSINADFHFVPTVHLQDTDRAAVKAYAATAGATATINPAAVIYDAPAPLTASFSSRGPILAGGGDLLKPDVIAPGEDILAAVAPPGNAGRDFNLYSGTSMSSPHVAGLAALLKSLHPTWTPMMIKSALMTSATDILDAPNTDPLVIFSQGAGHVRPNSAADPGLVFNSGWNDWLAFLCGTTNAVSPATCSAVTGLGYSTDASDMNVASIAIGDLAGIQTVTRRVTNVGSAPATYIASFVGLAGVTVEVSPASLSLNPGQTGSFTVKFTNAAAALNAYVGGQLTWSDGTHNVRIPVVVRPVALAAPDEVFAEPDAGASYTVKFGYTGPFTAAARGLVPAVITENIVADDPTDSTCDLTSPNVKLIQVAISAGTTYTRFSLFDEDVDPGSDLDLCVFRGTTLVGISGSGTSAEEVNLVNPEADIYTVVVQGWEVAGSSPFKLHTWLLRSADEGNMTVSAPATAILGGTGTITLAFSGLAPGTKYLGSVVYGGTAGLPDPTIVRVDVP